MDEGCGRKSSCHERPGLANHSQSAGKSSLLHADFVLLSQQEICFRGASLRTGEGPRFCYLQDQTPPLQPYGRAPHSWSWAVVGVLKAPLAQRGGLSELHTSPALFCPVPCSRFPVRQSLLKETQFFREATKAGCKEANLQKKRSCLKSLSRITSVPVD